jgi:hypothetical protein
LSPTAAGTWSPTIVGQPLNATIAVAITNVTAAPASNDPTVPRLARYALVARI